MKTTKEEKRGKVTKMVLPVPDATCLKHEPRNGPTRILTAAVWLKMSQKYFNEGTAKEACERFNVWAKQLSRVFNQQKVTSVVLRLIDAGPLTNHQPNKRKTV